MRKSGGHELCLLSEPGYGGYLSSINLEMALQLGDVCLVIHANAGLMHNVLWICEMPQGPYLEATSCTNAHALMGTTKIPDVLLQVKHGI